MEPDLEDATPDVDNEDTMKVETDPPRKKVVPPTQDEYLWKWAVRTLYTNFFILLNNIIS